MLFIISLVGSVLRCSDDIFLMVFIDNFGICFCTIGDDCIAI